MRIFVFLIIFLVIRSVIRAARGSKQPARPSVPRTGTGQQQARPETVSQEGRSQNPDYVRTERGVQSKDPKHHHHKEKVVVQAGDYAGEGDPDRYQEREICCETDHAPQQPAVSLAVPDADALVNAVIWSEILGKPRAYHNMNGGTRA